MSGADVFGPVISLVLFCYLVYALMVRPDTKVTVLVPRRAMSASGAACSMTRRRPS